MSRKNDQTLVMAPPVVFATQEAGNRIVADLRARHHEAAQYAAAQGGMAVQLGEEITQLQNEVNEKLAWITQKEGEKRHAETEAQAARDVAKGYADVLAAAGVHVPPVGGELSHDPDGNLGRLVAAHDELERSGGHS